MGETRLVQICYEGDLTLEACDALRRLGSEPNFDQSWEVWIPASKRPEVVARWLRKRIGVDARLLVAETDFTKDREMLLVRHSMTPGADYREMHEALGRLGRILELPFESVFVLEAVDRTDVRLLGDALKELCPDESLMIMGIERDFAWCNGTLDGLFAPILELDVGEHLGEV